MLPRIDLKIFSEPFVKKCCVVLLNHANTWDGFDKILQHFWLKCELRVAVDGGGNLIAERRMKDESFPIPHLLTGDFDSISPKTLENYRKDSGVEVVETMNQNETDLTKCLRVVIERKISANFEHILILGGLGGRFDHTMGSLHSLYSIHEQYKISPILLEHHSLVTLLPAGRYVVDFDLSMSSKYCGLFALGQPVKASTTGLKWDLNDTTLSFHGIISSCNEVLAQEFEITASHPLLFSMDLAKNA